MVICKTYSAEAKACWDHFVGLSRTPLFFFKRDYLEYHADRFIDASLLFYLKDKVVAIFPACKQGEILYSHAGLTYGGLLLAERLHSEEVIAVVASLAQQALELGFKKIIYKAIPYLFYQQAAQDDLYALVNNLGAKIFRRDLSSVIYLDNRMKLSKGRKWLIARAKKSGLAVKNSKAWPAFHHLLAQALERHKTTPVHSIVELESLSSLFPDNIQLKVIEKKLSDPSPSHPPCGHLLPEGRRENEGSDSEESALLAAVLLFKFHTTVHTQYLATNAEGKAFGALDFLIETCIEEAKSEGYQYFSFGISTEQQGKILNSGLIAQKENFGARGLVLDFYEIELNGKVS